MKKQNFWEKVKKEFSKVEEKGERVLKNTGEMTRQIQRMGQLDGQLFMMKAGQQ